MTEFSQDKTLERIFDDVARADVAVPPEFMRAAQMAALAALPTANKNNAGPSSVDVPSRFGRFSAVGGLVAAAVCGLWIGAVLPQMVGVGQASASIAVPLYQDLDVYALLEE